MKTINQSLLSTLCAEALKSPRLRSHHNIHDSLDEKVQRLLIGLQPGTYIQPHYHPEEHKKEMITLLQGSCTCLTFDDNGKVTDKVEIDSETPIVEFPDKQFHSIICTSPNTIILEVKKGPYTPLKKDCFANWAPEEGSKAVPEYLKTLLAK